MKRLMILILALVSAVTVSAQTDRKEVRAGNKAFRKGDFRKSEIDYRRAVLKDSLSVAAQYNLASSLYRQDDYEGAQKALSSIAETVSGIEAAGTKADFYFNQGDVALAQKDYASAVKSFRQSLLLRPDDMDAKENYIYAKEMLRQSQDNQGGQDGDNSQNQDDQNNQNNQDNQDNNQQQNNDNQQQNNQNQQNPQDQNNAAAEGNISRQQARQMLNAIQAKEKETQDKVKKEKAEMLKSRQKEKNW
ncbi:MAG: tetratricopeptide repeat protein [Bacteroides sp.]|nr:tetratricopeptide repeat protein [Bacteroides sp.]MDY5890642.1 tetratricopeptide repeat protein [Candidatus Cryptobacteroides sp.]